MEKNISLQSQFHIKVKKKANRDLNGSQRYTLMMYARDALRINRGENDDI